MAFERTGVDAGDSPSDAEAVQGAASLVHTEPLHSYDTNSSTSEKFFSIGKK